MLTDVLGTMLAFVTVILLLSILVTALVQSTQALLRLRGRNLLWGVTQIVRQAGLGGEEGAPAHDSPKQSRKEARKILNQPDVALLYQEPEPQGPARTFLQEMLGPKLSWADPDVLARALEEREAKAWGKQEERPGPRTSQEEGKPASEKPTKERPHQSGSAGEESSGPPSDPGGAKTEATEAPKEASRQRVDQMQKQMGKRFELQIRSVALFWAIVVAAGFQVSTPELLSQLSQNTALRERILTEVPRLLANESQTLAAIDYQDVTPEVITELGRRFPKYKDKFEQLSGVGTRKEFVVDELRLVLKGSPDLGAVEKAYSELLDSATNQKTQLAIAEFAKQATTLSGFEIQFWANDEYFFADSHLRVNAIIGVLITAVLLSFGAPFWFSVLREVAFLRDRLSPSKPKKKEENLTVLRLVSAEKESGGK